MLELPTRIPDRAAPLARRRWTAAGWTALCDTGEAPDRLLRGLLAVQFERYGAGASVRAGAEAARLLAADAGTLRWADLLRAVDGLSDGPADAPSVVVGIEATESAGADLMFTAAHAEVEVAFRPAAYPPGTVERILDHLERLAAQLADDPDLPLSALDLLTPQDRAVNGGTPAELPDHPPVTLHQLVSLQTWRTPDAEAIRHGTASMTYRQLEIAANQLAHRLTAHVPPGGVVAVAGERRIGLFVALLATLKAGGVFLYLDPDQPAARLAEFLDLSDARLVLRGPGAVLPATALPVVEFDALPAPDPSMPRTAPNVVVGPEDPAYVLFTSGSTGVPKGVLRSHRLHTSTILLQSGLYGFGSADRHLLKLVISARELFLPLTTGGTAVVADQGGERDDRYLVELIRRERISVISFVPSMLRVLSANAGFAACADLRQIFVGGEALPPDLEESLRAMGYGVDNAYVLTEADHVASRGEPVPGGGSGASVLGEPRNARVYLCDDRGRLVPPGVVGEILVGGPGLASGYVGDPVRTAERFIANPFGDPQAPIVFRTGDLARHRPDGLLEYHGRRDLQIKVRGQRVEPTDVEHHLREHPGVHDVAVVGYPDAEQGGMVVAFLVPVDGATPDDHDLRRFLRQRLPEYMVPRYLVRLARLPQLPSGKVDRQALRAPAAARPEDLGPPAPPGTETQRRVRELWQRVLHAGPVGIDDDFTQLGGDSLRVLVLRSAIEDEFGTTVELALLLGASTIRAQAELLTGGSVTAAPAPAVTPPGGGSRALAAAERQRRGALRGAQAARRSSSS